VQLKQNLKDLAEVQANLQDTKRDIADISTRLGGFETVWASVSDQLHVPLPNAILN
jgi:hypothetical protein